MRFGAILSHNKGWSTKVQNMLVRQVSRNWNFKVDLDTHLRDKHGHLFLWDFELFWPTFKVGQTNVENIHFFDPLGIEMCNWI